MPLMALVYQPACSLPSVPTYRGAVAWDGGVAELIGRLDSDNRMPPTLDDVLNHSDTATLVLVTSGVLGSNTPEEAPSKWAATAVEPARGVLGAAVSAVTLW